MSKREREIFETALSYEGESRRAFIRQACSGDAALEERVGRLILAHERAGRTSRVVPLPAELRDPRSIGPYRILERVGEGGMGVVYVAEQTEPVRRKVALKVIKAGMDTREVIARFHSERQALALMNHPNIARILDLGATREGRPYFVMERVAGLPLLEYCDDRRMSVDERVRLFIPICQAVQHAHQKGVIHRDIKPSNILVTEIDQVAVPKVIDFGIAKAIHQPLSDITLHTRLGNFIGTPDYSSPEQAEMGSIDVDTRADVYSLGAVLYELLVGARPLDFGDPELALGDIQRLICEQDPKIPSVRVSCDDAADEWAAKRGTDALGLERALRNDLDWIVMKALEKDRRRRYNSPLCIEEDLERYLTNEPVDASPPSTAYRARKFVARHSLAVGLATAGVLVLAVIAGTMTVQSQRIARQRDRIELEAGYSQSVSEFLTDLFRVSNPHESAGDTITARELLDRGLQQIETLGNQPELQARLLLTMGDVYRQLGSFSDAQGLLERALETRERQLGADHPDTLLAQAKLASLRLDLGHEAEAQSMYVAAYEGLRRELDPDDPRTFDVLNDLGNAHHRLGRYDEAEQAYVRALGARRRILGDEDRETIVSISNLALLYQTQGRLEESEALNLEAYETSLRVFGETHPSTLAAANNLAMLYRELGRYADAERLYTDALAINRRILGENHPQTLVCRSNLGEVYTLSGRPEQAEPFLDETVERMVNLLSERHFFTAVTRRKHGASLTALGRYDDAETELLESWRVLSDDLGPRHPQAQKVVVDTIALYEAWSRPEEVETWRARRMTADSP